jgi:hypothetical protein
MKKIIIFLKISTRFIFLWVYILQSLSRILPELRNFMQKCALLSAM